VTATVPSTPPGAGNLPPDTAILGIETSCDETAAAVVLGGHVVRSSVVSSQVDIHARYGGVVPEIASRAHVDLLAPVIAEALVEAGVDGPDLDAVAATVGPGTCNACVDGVDVTVTMELPDGEVQLDSTVVNFDPANDFFADLQTLIADAAAATGEMPLVQR